MCDRLYETARWLNATAAALACTQGRTLRDALNAMPADDDRDWVNSEIHVGRDNQTIRGLPILSLIGKVSYHLFGTAQASDVKYNCIMIKQ